MGCVFWFVYVTRNTQAQPRMALVHQCRPLRKKCANCFLDHNQSQALNFSDRTFSMSVRRKHGLGILVFMFPGKHSHLWDGTSQLVPSIQ